MIYWIILKSNAGLIHFLCIGSQLMLIVHMKVQHTYEVKYVEHYEPEALHEILGTHLKTPLVSKKHRGDNTLCQWCLILLISRMTLAFCRKSKLAHTLYIVGRHIMILTIIATQQILHCTAYAEWMELIYVLLKFPDHEQMYIHLSMQFRRWLVGATL